MHDSDGVNGIKGLRDEMGCKDGLRRGRWYNVLSITPATHCHVKSRLNLDRSAEMIM